MVSEINTPHNPRLATSFSYLSFFLLQISLLGLALQLSTQVVVAIKERTKDKCPSFSFLG